MSQDIKTILSSPEHQKWLETILFLFLKNKMHFQRRFLANFSIITLKLILLCNESLAQKKLVCLETKSEVDSALWTSNSVLKSAKSTSDLPKAFGDLTSLRSSGEIFYLEGPSTGTAKEVVFKSPLNAYPNKVKSVTLYLKYYANSPRRVTLVPNKPGPNGGSLLLLPAPNATGQAKWMEVTAEIDPTTFPIEITAFLGANQFLLVDKLVLAVDTPLPSDLSLSCKTMQSPPTSSPSSPTNPPPPSPWTSTRPGSTTTVSRSNSDCPALPQLPECKCNCMCNCNKC